MGPVMSVKKLLLPLMICLVLPCTVYATRGPEDRGMIIGIIIILITIFLIVFAIVRLVKYIMRKK